MKRKKRLLLGTLVIFFLVLLLNLFSGISYITSPFINAGRHLQTLYFNILSHTGEFTDEEFKELKAERDSFREEVIRLREENYKLRHMLDIKEEVLNDIHKVLPAQVVQTHLGRGERTYLIQGGTEQGFHENDIVLSSEGLVGKITHATTYYSQVLLIIDSNSSLPALIQKNRLQGIIYGTGDWNELIMELDGPAEDVEPGDMIVTSGMGVIFPPGILIGFVEEILPDRYGLANRLMIEPAVDFRRLEIVGISPRKDES